MWVRASCPGKTRRRGSASDAVRESHLHTGGGEHPEGQRPRAPMLEPSKARANMRDTRCTLRSGLASSTASSVVTVR